MGTRKRSRREVLRLGGGALIGAGPLAGCDLSTGPAERSGGAGGTRAGRDAKEAPALAEQVKAGTLPELAERLPDDPLVLEPLEEPGIYGGELRMALVGAGDAWRLDWVMTYENLLRWNDSFDEVIPQVAQSYEANEDGTEYIFRLRPGMKWSDGEPFTADDVVFARNDVLNNSELFPEADESVRAEKVDDHTVRFTFDEPAALFAQQLAANARDLLTAAPRHYLEKFHVDHNPDAKALAEKEGASDWAELFQQKMGIGPGSWQNTELPTRYPWVLKTGVGEGSRVVFERNPYYWKTDPDGRQLPYIDRVIFEMVDDVEVLLLRTLRGEVDFVDRHINRLQNKPVLARDREVGDYRFFDLIIGKENMATIMLNLVHRDPVKREIFQKRDFRIGLSHAINRQEIIDTAFAGQGEPRQSAPPPESPFHHEELATQYIEYDVDKANQYLDRAGYADRNSDGIRLGPDGSPIAFTVEFTTGGKPEWADVLDLVSGYWREVGVKMSPKPVEHSLFYERKAANEHDANIWDTGGLNVLLSMFHAPLHGECNYAIPWAQWYTSDGAAGEEPSEAAKRQMELYDRIKQTTDADEQHDLAMQILDIAREEFYSIGISRETGGYGIVHNRVGNAPEETFFDGDWPYPAGNNLAQFFIREGQ